MIHSKSRLAIALSKLEVFDTPSHKHEQYPTDSEVAADALWNAYFLDDIEEKVIADLGAGTGILGLGALMLGAKKVHFIERDEQAMEILKRNHDAVKEELEGEAVFHLQDMEEFDETVDVVIQNPPFGTREKHADRNFLEKAFTLSPTIYSFHKETSENFLKKFSDDSNVEITHHWSYEFPIKASQLFHKRKIHRIKVGCWRFKRKKVTDFDE